MRRLSLLFPVIVLAACDAERVYHAEDDTNQCWIGDWNYYTGEELPLELTVSFEDHSDARLRISSVDEQGYESESTTVHRYNGSIYTPFACGETIRLEITAYTLTTVWLDGELPDDVEVDYHWDIGIQESGRRRHYGMGDALTYPSIVIDIYAGETATIYVRPVEP